MTDNPQEIEDMYSKRLRCANHELCHYDDPMPGGYLPDLWHIWVEGKPLCINCHMMFGTWNQNDGVKHTGKGVLDFKDNIECPVCLDTTRCVSQPRCEHWICLGCFRRCYYPVRIPHPEFPYPEIEDEYDEDPDNEKWNEYPEIAKWNDEVNRLLDIEEEQYEIEEYLRACPLCRS